MKSVVIAGPRDLFPTRKQVEHAISNSGFEPDVIISGGADGVDLCAYNYAKNSRKYIAVKVEPRWDYWRDQGTVGAAGPERNKYQAKLGDSLIIMKRIGPYSKGTASMLWSMRRAEKPIHIETIT